MKSKERQLLIWDHYSCLCMLICQSQVYFRHSSCSIKEFAIQYKSLLFKIKVCYLIQEPVCPVECISLYLLSSGSTQFDQCSHCRTLSMLWQHTVRSCSHYRTLSINPLYTEPSCKTSSISIKTVPTVIILGSVVHQVVQSILQPIDSVLCGVFR